MKLTRCPAGPAVNPEVLPDPSAYALGEQLIVVFFSFLVLQRWSGALSPRASVQARVCFSEPSVWMVMNNPTPSRLSPLPSRVLCQSQMYPFVLIVPIIFLSGRWILFHFFFTILLLWCQMRLMWQKSVA